MPPVISNSGVDFSIETITSGLLENEAVKELINPRHGLKA